MPIWAAPLVGFRNWMSYTPTIPKFYWDVYSEEERIKKICMCLHKIEEYLNYQTDTINTILEHWDELDERLEALETWKLLVDVHLAAIDTSLDALAEEDSVLHDLIDELNANLDAYKEEMNERLAYLHDEFREADAELYATLHQEIENIDLDHLFVIDPTDSIGWSTISKTLRRMYDQLRYYALTAEEYDSLQLTAQNYDALSMTAMDYDIWGAVLTGYMEAGTPIIPSSQTTVVETDMLIAASDWEGNVFKGFEDAWRGVDYTLIVAPTNVMSNQELTAWQDAVILDYEGSQNWLVARGTVPQADLHVSVTAIRKD